MNYFVVIDENNCPVARFSENKPLSRFKIVKVSSWVYCQIEGDINKQEPERVK